MTLAEALIVLFSPAGFFPLVTIATFVVIALDRDARRTFDQRITR